MRAQSGYTASVARPRPTSAPRMPATLDPDQKERRHHGGARRHEQEEPTRVAGRQRGLIVGQDDGLRDLRAGHQHDDGARGMEARVIEQLDQRDADEGQQQEHRDRAAAQGDPHQLELLEVRGRGVRRAVAVERDQHPASDGAGEQQRKAREEVAEIVDAEQFERQVLAKDEPVALGDQKAADGAQEYPLAEVNEVVTRLRLPAKAVAVARQQQVGQRRASRRWRTPLLPPATRSSRSTRQGRP